MATYALGKIGMNLRGTYDASATYHKLDVVTYNGSSYAALQTCTGVPVTNAEYWQMLCIGNAESYTTNEVCTGGTWIDGKPIYRKTIQISSIATNAEIRFDFMPVSEISDIVSIRGTAYINDGWGWIFMPVSSNTSTKTDKYSTIIEIDCSEEMATFVVYTGTDRTIGRGFIIVEYTKGA